MPREEYEIGDRDTNDSGRGGFDRGGGGPGMARGGKAKNFGRAIRQLTGYCKKYLPAIGAAGVLAVIGTILNVIGPNQVSKLTDLITQNLFTGIHFSDVLGVILVLTALYGLGFLFGLGQGMVMTTITQKIAKSLRTDISGKINRLPFRYFDNSSIGDTLSRMTNDVDTLSQTLSQSLGSVATSFVTFAGALVMMFYMNWIMALVGISAAALGFVFMMAIISHSQTYFMQQQGELGRLNGHIEESYAGHSVVKAYNGEAAVKAAFGSMNQKLYNCAWKSQAMSGLMQPLMTFTGNFDYVAVCIVGAVLALKGVISFGVIVAFTLYIRLFTQSLSQFAQVAQGLQSAAAASERVFQFLEEEELSDESGKTQTLNEVSGNVEFKDVRFGYSDDKIVVRDFSANVKAGQKIAIVGPTGAGKTTLVNLIMRFYEMQSGEIKIDGTPISSLSREYLHSLFCMVLQDTWLFEGTIKENIIYAKEGVTDEQVITACKAAGLHHFIKTLPQGYDTVLNDNATLSAGQKQLITIARAMIENAPMLILDEATSSVDTRTEVLIQKAMDRLMSGRTSFVIAHRLSTIRDADLILVMKDGDIIESGTHEALMQQNGFYTDLYNSQFERAS